MHQPTLKAFSYLIGISFYTHNASLLSRCVINICCIFIFNPNLNVHIFYTMGPSYQTHSKKKKVLLAKVFNIQGFILEIFEKWVRSLENTAFCSLLLGGSKFTHLTSASRRLRMLLQKEKKAAVWAATWPTALWLGPITELQAPSLYCSGGHRAATALLPYNLASLLILSNAWLSHHFIKSVSVFNVKIPYFNLSDIKG